MNSMIMRFQNPLFLLITILLVAAALRIPYADGRSTYADQERKRDLAVVSAMAEGEVPLVGPPSAVSEFRFGPVYYYLLFPLAYATGFRPYSLAITSMFFSLLTIVFMYLLVREWWKDRWLALGTSAIMAISMFDIQFAKYASNPNFIPFFTLVFFWALRRLSTEKTGWREAAALGLGFGVVTQLHAVPLLVMTVVLILMLILRKIQMIFRQWFVFVAVVVGLYIPYLAYEFSHGFVLLGALAESGTQMIPMTTVMDRLVEYFGFWVSTVVSIHPFFDVAFISGKAFLPIAAVTLLPIILLVRSDRLSVVKGKSHTRHVTHISSHTRFLLILWFISSTLVVLLPLGGARRGIYIYYFFIFAPLAYMFIARALHLLITGRFRRTGLYLTCVYVLVQAVQLGLYHRLVAGIAT